MLVSQNGYNSCKCTLSLYVVIDAASVPLFQCKDGLTGNMIYGPNLGSANWWSLFKATNLQNFDKFRWICEKKKKKIPPESCCTLNLLDCFPDSFIKRRNSAYSLKMCLLCLIIFFVFIVPRVPEMKLFYWFVWWSKLDSGSGDKLTIHFELSSLPPTSLGCRQTYLPWFNYHWLPDCCYSWTHTHTAPLIRCQLF